MNLQLQLFLIAFVVLLAVIIVSMLRKERLELKYTLLWLAALVVTTIVVFAPQIVFQIAAWVGIINPVNLVFFVEGAFVIAILLSVTAIVSGQNRKIRRLAQEIALLEERLRTSQSAGQD
jgi:hypothetical protein